jgi:hypothetical protein
MVVLEMLDDRLSPDVVDRISDRIGADPDTTSNAIDTALPLLITAMADNLSDDHQLQSLTAAVAADHDGSVLDDVPGFVSHAEGRAGQGILSHVLGGSRLRVERSLGQITGLAAGTAGHLLSVLAPLVMGALGRARRELGLSRRGLATMLTVEQEQLNQAAPGMMGRLRRILGSTNQRALTVNIRGMLGKTFGANSNREDAMATEPKNITPEGKTYTVVRGDSLSKIAKREYGDAGKWRKIFEANKDVIENPDLIEPGQELIIPER